MSGYDYASELLGSKSRRSPSAPRDAASPEAYTDYASQLLGGAGGGEKVSTPRMMELETALINADKAGDTQAAQTLANEILRQRKAATVPTEQDPLAGAVSTTPGGAVTAVHGRAGLTQRAKEATNQGLSLEDFKDQIANYDATDNTTASFGTLVKAAMVDDPETKLKIFAQARFPKDKSAANRYGLIGDEVVYVGTDGRLYRETPAGAMGWVKEAGAGIAGKGLPIAGGMAGGAVAAGPAGMIAGAGLGAAGGEAARKIVGGLVFDEPITPEGALKSMAMEGAFSSGGALLGAGVVKWINRNAARDIGKLNRAAATDLTKKADRVGVELNPAQTTNLPSIKGKFEALARMPTSADVIQEGMERQAQQANRAAYHFLQQVSTREGIEEIGEEGVKAAGKVISMVAKDRATKAAPLYQRAFEQFEQIGGIPPQLVGKADELMKRPALQAAARRAVILAKNEGVDLADPKKSLLGMHYMKLALDDAIENAGRNATGSTFKRGLVDIKTQLVGIMDDLSPTYAEARKVFAHYSPSVEAIKGGVVARISELPPEKVSEAARLLFKPGSSPKAIEQARSLFLKAGLQDDYNALLRSYLQETFEQAGRQYSSAGGLVGQAPKWRAAMLGDPSQARVLRAAMTPQQWQGFSEMSEVFEAMGRVSGRGNSITMPMQEAAGRIRQESGAGLMGQIAGLASPQEIGRRFMEWRMQARVGAHAEKLAQIMTSPQGMRQLKDLVKLDPGSEKFILRASALFGISVAPAVNPRDAR